MSPPFASILHREAIQKLADTRSFARGRDYFARGKVRSLTRRGTSLTGVVEGESPYAIRIWVKDQSLAYTCSCPQGEEGNFCKHCVALSLAWLAEAAKTPIREGK
ncbi:MAG: SWIM zinc finger family protein [Polyangiaceae bacterium]